MTTKKGENDATRKDVERVIRVDKDTGAPVIRCDNCSRIIKDTSEAFYGYRPAFAGDPHERTTGFVVHLHRRCGGPYARTHGPTNSWVYHPLHELFEGLAALAAR